MALRFILLSAIGILLFFGNLFIGSVKIPFGEVFEILAKGSIDDGPMSFIILGSRLPQAFTSIFAGAALTVAGLLLQTAFRNPLAGPSILGITSGAGLGVAIVMLFLGGTISFAGITAGGYVAVLIGALAGSLIIMGILLLFSVWLKSNLMLLIAGIMTGYLTSSIVTLLNYLSSADGIRSYTMWGMGTFGGVSREQMPIFAGVVIIGLLLSVFLVKPLNILMLGDNYAKNLGISLHRVRNLLLVSTGVLTSVVTAFCGPIGFIGLAVPHISRMIFRSSDHRILIPACILTGAITGLLCNLLIILPGEILLPLNAVTPLIGVPVILWVIFQKR